MAQFFLLLSIVALLSGNSIFAQSKPQLLTLEQQQELIMQLVQLQLQTQQLLAAQQSLAAAIYVTNSATVSPKVTMSQLIPKKSSLLEPNATQPAPPKKQTRKPNPKKVINPKPARKPVPMVTPEPPLPHSSQIDYGKCPELEPSMSTKLSKVNEITACLENTPFSENITRESLEQHREQIALCTLSAEGWITQSGGYDYGKAEMEIKSKRLQKEIELQLLSYHPLCKTESEMKDSTSNNSIIAQIQLYQACMDYWISEVCGIVVKSV